MKLFYFIDFWSILARVGTECGPNGVRITRVVSIPGEVSARRCRTMKYHCRDAKRVTKERLGVNYTYFIA